MVRVGPHGATLKMRNSGISSFCRSSGPSRDFLGDRSSVAELIEICRKLWIRASTLRLNGDSFNVCRGVRARRWVAARPPFFCPDRGRAPGAVRVVCRSVLYFPVSARAHFSMKNRSASHHGTSIHSASVAASIPSTNAAPAKFACER